ICFFFSSRRRHTRFSRDWSSDVCSSDLCGRVDATGGITLNGQHAPRTISSTEPGDDVPGNGLPAKSGERTLDHLAARLVNGRLTGVPVERNVDLARIERAGREILIAVGEDPDRGGLLLTPTRVGGACAELVAGLRVDPASVLATGFDANHQELVLVRDIDLISLCEHHLLPFQGKAHIGYIPGSDGRITGLSKLARLVEVFARRPQVQERLTTQVADLLMEQLQPRGVIVVLECEHLCMAMRG